jgi:glycosyltransferase involved in cell wall biosynthesis
MAHWLAELFRRLLRRLRGINERCITLPALGPGPVRGHVLLSYIIDAAMIRTEEELPHSHVNFWETWTMAQCFREEGYVVDIIHWSRRRPLPRTDYDIFVDVRRNFDWHAAVLPTSCLKVAHMDTSHFRFHNASQRRRLEDLRQRRGIALAPFKLVEENTASENADVIAVIGNDITMGTFAYAGKPIHRIRLSNARSYPFPDRKDFNASRRRFLWLGSEGFVHKGLDLTLEAFAGLPDHELVVCGPLDKEPAFVKAFANLLYETPNIRAEGWVDIAGARFQELANQCVGLIYPSCSEGCAGCVVTAMHAGLIPIVTRESGVDVEPERGILLPDATIASIQKAIRNLSGQSAAELETRARAAWTWVRETHTRERFKQEYRAWVRELSQMRKQA